MKIKKMKLQYFQNYFTGAIAVGFVRSFDNDTRYGDFLFKYSGGVHGRCGIISKRDWDRISRKKFKKQSKRLSSK